MKKTVQVTLFLLLIGLGACSSLDGNAAMEDFYKKHPEACNVGNPYKACNQPTDTKSAKTQATAQ